MFKISVEIESLCSKLTEALFTGVAIATAKKVTKPSKENRRTKFKLCEANLF